MNSFSEGCTEAKIKQNDNMNNSVADCSLASEGFSSAALKNIACQNYSVMSSWVKESEATFSEMLESYQNEYVFLNQLFNKIVLGTHSLNTTTAFSQLWVENSKADFVVINGKAVVYEIKTDLDNLSRLEGQLADYYKAFSNVVVVCGEKNLPSVLRFAEASSVGVLCMKRKGSFATIKPYIENNDQLDSEAIFRLLRKPEYTELILSLGEDLPVCKEVDYYQECKAIVSSYPAIEVAGKAMTILKKRDRIKKEGSYKTIPYSLRASLYFSNLTKKERSRFFDLAV
ncbi:MAG: sce7726 family protein [Candidatus Cloacimonetes bacterium]|nr:sce7726 family protein [Candidatus Cloacimonadota bacterium]